MKTKILNSRTAEIHSAAAALRAGGLTGCAWQVGEDFVA